MVWRLLSAFPDPIPGFFSSTGQNFFQEPSGTSPISARTPSRLTTIRVRSTRSNAGWRSFTSSTTSAFRGGTDRAPQIIDRPNQTTSINWTWTVSPTWISETLVAGSRDQVDHSS